MVYSFDIFDTCFVRTCGRAQYVFDILAERILGKNASETMCMDFSYIRRKAEEVARKKYISNEIEEITIEQIYHECDFTKLTSIPNCDILKMEMELEKEVLIPVYSIKKKIADIHNVGDRVMFISDMYLPTFFIKKILVASGLFIDGDKIYVSSDVKKTKATGNLYLFVKEKENLNFKEWNHTGDNRYSDYIVPRRLGIVANNVIHKFSEYELQLAKKETEGGKLNRHLLSSISKSIRYSLQPSPELYVASDFIAPIYVPFVYEIMEHASINGIKDLFFLARDGYIFYKIAEAFSKEFPLINIHYLYVSRKSLYLPSLDTVSYESLMPRLSYIENFGIEDICERLQIKDEISSFSNYSSLKGEDLLDSLLKDAIFVERVNCKRNIQRDLCLRYFKQEGLTNGQAAIIDLSGSRRCHMYINSILSSSGYEPVFGYYLDVTDDHIVSCDYFSCFQVSRGLFNMSVTKSPQNVFEQYFSVSFHESTNSYEERNGIIYPVFCSENEINDKAKVVLDNNIVACQMFAKYFLLLIDKTKSKEYIGDGLSVFNYFSMVPDYYYIKAFVGIIVSESSLRSRKIIEECNFVSCLRRRRNLYWKLPSLVYNFPYHNFLTRLLRLRYYYKCCFCI